MYYIILALAIFLIIIISYYKESFIAPGRTGWAADGGWLGGWSADDERYDAAKKMFGKDKLYMKYHWNRRDNEGYEIYDYVYDNILEKNNSAVYDIKEVPPMPTYDMGVIAYGHPLNLSQKYY